MSTATNPLAASAPPTQPGRAPIPLELSSWGTIPAHEWSSPEQMRVALARERERFHRTGEAFVFLIIGWSEPDRDAAGLEALRRILHHRLRTTDQFGWADERHVGVLLLSANTTAALPVVAHLRDAYPADLPRLTYDVYYYSAESPPASRDAAPRAVRLDASRRRSTSTPLVPLACGAEDAVAFRPMQALFIQPLPRWKRCLDIVGASVGLIVCAPLLLILMAIIRIVQTGPAIFRQQRTGLGGKPFTIYKLRTMHDGADLRKHELRPSNIVDGPAFKIPRDPRVFWLGHFLRTTSLDELPQLWNVLKGDMSLVGPRPLPVDESLGCDAWQKARLDSTPGLTGLWQVSGRSNIPFVSWMRMDLRYNRSRSLGQDLRLLIRTIPAVLFRKGAH